MSNNYASTSRRYPAPEKHNMCTDKDDSPFISISPESLSSASSSDCDDSDDSNVRCSSPDTPASEVPSSSLPFSHIDACICHYNSKCPFCITIFEKVYSAVRKNLQSNTDASDVVMKVKHLLPSETFLFKAPKLVDVVVEEMENVQRDRNWLDAKKNDLVCKGFKLLYRIWDFFAGDTIEQPSGNSHRLFNPHPPILDRVRSSNVLSLARHAPVYLDLYATCVVEADGQTNAQFVRLAHWVLYRAMMGKVQGDRTVPIKVSNNTISRLIKFFIQFPHYMIVDTAFIFTTLLQSTTSTLYPTLTASYNASESSKSKFPIMDPYQSFYRSYIRGAVTKETMFAALGAAMKANYESIAPSMIAMELQLDVMVGVMELYKDGVQGFESTSACRELGMGVALALVRGGAGVRDAVKERVVQVFDRIVVTCFKRIDGTKGQTKFLYKLLPLFTIKGAMTAYLYHGWGASYNNITQTQVKPGSSTPPVFAAMNLYLHTQTHNLLRFTKCQSPKIDLNLTWQDRKRVVDVLGGAGEVYDILKEIYENQGRLHGEVEGVGNVLRDESGCKGYKVEVDVLADWQMMFAKAKGMLYLTLGERGY